MNVYFKKRLQTNQQKKIYLDEGIQWLKEARIKSLYVIIEKLELDVATHMVYTCSHGLLKPNIVLIGYKSNWLNCPYKDLQTYLNVFKLVKF